MHDDSILIPLTRGKFAIIDAEDAERILRYKWHATRPGYAMRRRRLSEPPGPSLVMMHNEIAGRPLHGEWDHANGNKIDNRKVNLRLATRSQNMANVAMWRHNTSGFHGVAWDVATHRWRAKIKVNRRTIHLGRFDNIEDAARAYDVAALKYFGEFACLNFAHTPESSPLPSPPETV